MKDARDDNPCPAAHKRAVMTVRLTLLLVIIGVAFLLFSGPGGFVPLAPKSGERHSSR